VDRVEVRRSHEPAKAGKMAESNQRDPLVRPQALDDALRGKIETAIKEFKALFVSQNTNA